MSVAIRSGSPQFPAIVGSIPPTSQQEMDSALADLQAHKDAWVAVAIPDRIALLERLMRDFLAIAERWVAACLQAKGLAPDAPGATDEWVAGVYPVVRNLAQLRRSLVDLQRTGHPRIPGPVTTRPGGQVVAQVFPQSAYDKMFFMGITAEVWMQPGVTAADLPTTMAVAYHDKAHPGKVALVLGAGNVSSIGPLDALYKLFVEDQVVAYKANPVNAYLGPLLAEAFRALVEPGYLRLVYGGAAEGAYLCNHPSVDEIHITGSDKTFDAIVFGPGAEGAARKAAGQPLLTKRITGELGNVSPVIVVPGPWKASDLAYQADHIASMLTNNAGFNCNATRVILQHAGWSQRPALLRGIGQALARVPSRAAYYPGARDRYQQFVAGHPQTQEYGDQTGDKLPWALIPDVDPANPDDVVFTTEAFCSLFAETPIAAESVAEYLDRAVAFANDHLWGTLNATILVHPASLRDPAVRAALERAVANLRYGSVAVNYWAAASYILGCTTWGGFPGQPLADIQSGNDVVHNTLMFARAEKSVIRAPFRSLPTPPWFASRAKAGAKVFRRLSRLEAAPSLAKVPGVLVAAMS
ncbi:MAG TPA: aldehyde dehydrogenase family protein [Ktedonobacterales bacterium]|jgi:acyl-CoA reductase-like NAD-dependent aldehyde dehydrogenase